MKLQPEQRSVTGLSLAEVDRTLAALAAAIEPVDVRFTWWPQLSDADDEMVMEAAVNGRADALVAHNLGFTAVIPHRSNAKHGPASVRRSYGRFLRELEAAGLIQSTDYILDRAAARGRNAERQGRVEDHAATCRRLREQLARRDMPGEEPLDDTPRPQVGDRRRVVAEFP